MDLDFNKKPRQREMRRGSQTASKVDGEPGAVPIAGTAPAAVQAGESPLKLPSDTVAAAEKTAPDAVINTEAVREFLTVVSAHAKAALNGSDKPGVLQLTRLHPADRALVPSRFTFDDVEAMIKAALADCEHGHNVYIEGRTVRDDLRGGKRGDLADTVAVFALVIDSDADKRTSHSPSPPRHS